MTVNLRQDAEHLLRLRLRLGLLRYISGNWWGRYAYHIELAFGYAPKELVYEVLGELAKDGCVSRTMGAKGGIIYRIPHPDHALNVASTEA